VKHEVRLKRAYDAPEKGDGFRVLVDRMWPRGLRKEDLDIDVWAKDLAPSTELRKWFRHDPKRWTEFKKRYERELRETGAKDRIKELIDAAKGKRVITLLYGAKDREHNQAVVLQKLFR
jgi:uncharacterized protein YeaO (DUF488 family)